MGVTYINPYRFGFNPLSLSPALWLDAADTSTITSSSGAVSQWNDKSGNAYHLTQSAAINQPVTGTRTINGRNAIDFDGSNDFLVRDASTNILRNVSGATVYHVVSFDVSPTTEQLICIVRNGLGPARVSVTSGISSGKAAFGGRTLDGDSFARVDSTSSVSTTSAQAFTGVYDYANTDLYIYINNSLEGTNNSFQTATATSNTNSLGITVGANVIGGLPFNGLVAEIIVYQSAHNATQRADVYNYLAAKWGL